MPRVVWLIITAILSFFATLSLLDPIYWVIIGHDVEYGVGFIAGTFMFSLLLYGIAYWTWTKAKATAKLAEKAP